MTVAELIGLLTAKAAQLPDGLDSRVAAGVDDDTEQFAGVYTDLEVTTWPMPRRRDAVLVRGITPTGPGAEADPNP